MNNATLADNGLPRGHDGHEQHNQDQRGGCLPQQVAGVGVRDKTKSASLALMSSTSMNAVDVRPGDMAREKRVVNQQVPSIRWPLTAPEGHAALVDLQCN